MNPRASQQTRSVVPMSRFLPWIPALTIRRNGLWSGSRSHTSPTCFWLRRFITAMEIKTEHWVCLFIFFSSYTRMSKHFFKSGRLFICVVPQGLGLRTRPRGVEEMSKGQTYIQWGWDRAGVLNCEGHYPDPYLVCFSGTAWEERLASAETPNESSDCWVLVLIWIAISTLPLP